MKHLIRNITDVDFDPTKIDIRTDANDEKSLNKKLRELEEKLRQSESAIEEAYQEGLAKGQLVGQEIGQKEGESIGYSKGFQQGSISEREKLTDEENQARIQLERSTTNLIDLFSKLELGLMEEVGYFEPLAVELVFQVLIKILGRKAVERTLIKDVVHQSLSCAIESKLLKLRVSVADYALLVADSLSSELSIVLKLVEIVADPRILSGGCIVETASGELDARLDVQLERFKDYLLELSAQPIRQTSINGDLSKEDQSKEDQIKNDRIKEDRIKENRPNETTALKSVPG